MGFVEFLSQVRPVVVSGLLRILFGQSATAAIGILYIRHLRLACPCVKDYCVHSRIPWNLIK